MFNVRKISLIRWNNFFVLFTFGKLGSNFTRIQITFVEDAGFGSIYRYAYYQWGSETLDRWHIWWVLYIRYPAVYQNLTCWRLARYTAEYYWILKIAGYQTNSKLYLK
jgi:hypothetical protein